MAGVGSRASAARYVKGLRVAPRRVIVWTYVWSSGAVEPNDWYDLPVLTKAAPAPESPRAQEAA